ncbi:MAG: hypothetical protein ACXAE3_02800 [Candidatus Kariarchaeaceae archaeon]|jgi:hypothetical protein
MATATNSSDISRSLDNLFNAIARLRRSKVSSANIVKEELSTVSEHNADVAQAEVQAKINMEKVKANAYLMNAAHKFF